MAEILSSPLCGIALCIFTFKIGLWVNRRLKTPLANPLLIAISLVILLIGLTPFSYEQFSAGGSVISMLLPPATAVLASSIYREIEVLKRNFLPIMAGCLAGSLTSMASAYFLCKWFGLDETLTASMLPKSVTTPIAMELSIAGGGIAAVTVAAVIFTGIIGACLSPILIKLFKIENPVAAGVAIGTASHAIGTSKAIELGEVQGAMSGIAIGVAGLLTVAWSLVLPF